MTKAELDALRHPSEQSRFWVTLLIIVPVIVAAIAFAFATQGIAIVVVAFIIFAVWVGTKIAVARFLGGFVRVSQDNFSEIAATIDEFRTLFGYKGQIDAYVYEDGNFNACLVPLLGRKVILLNSDVIVNAKKPNEIRYIVARFIGGLASKHYRFMWLQCVLTSIEKIMIFNILLYPYERSIVKSGDQMGLHAIGGDVDSAIRASHKCMVGGNLGDRVNLAGILHQHKALNASFFGWLAKCLSPFPHQTARVVNLLRFANERYPVQMQSALTGMDEETLRLLARSIGERAYVDPSGDLAGQTV